MKQKSITKFRVGDLVRVKPEWRAAVACHFFDGGAGNNYVVEYVSGDARGTSLIHLSGTRGAVSWSKYIEHDPFIAAMAELLIEEEADGKTEAV